MRIDWALPCRYVEVNAGLATIIGAETNLFMVAPVPADIGLMVALKIVASESDESEHTFGSQVLGPDMQPVTEKLEANFSMGQPNPLKPAGWEQTMVVPVAVAFPAADYGQYTLVLSVDDRTASLSLGVVEPPGNAQQ